MHKLCTYKIYRAHTLFTYYAHIFLCTLYMQAHIYAINVHMHICICKCHAHVEGQHIRITPIHNYAFYTHILVLCTYTCFMYLHTYILQILINLYTCIMHAGLHIYVLIAYYIRIIHTHVMHYAYT